MTAAALVVLFVAAWEAMAGFILALSMLIGLAIWKNSQRKVKLAQKAVIYGILGAMLAVLDFAAIVDILRVGLTESWLEIGMIVMSAVLVGMAAVWEKRRIIKS